MAQAPQVVSADAIGRYCVSKQIDGEWWMARPISTGGLWMRLKCAWLVFTGRCDALTWYGQ